MTRVVIIVVVWLAVLVGGGWLYVAQMGREAWARGADRYLYRITLERQIEEMAAARPDVVWMGDSTVLGLRAISYPQVLRGGLPGVSYAVMGYLGSDFYTFYPVVGDLLEHHRPAVLVIVAHLRLFSDPRDDYARTRTTRNDLLSMVPADELPQTALLPLAARGMTIPRLLLARVLRYPWAEDALYMADGAQALVSEAELPWLGPTAAALPNNLAMMRLGLEASDVPVTRRHPVVRMMAATVRLARRAGVRVIVVGTPIPFEGMQRMLGYDPALYLARFRTLGAAVEEAGGVFVDLHDALAAQYFQDVVGHFDATGARILANRLRPILTREVQGAFQERATAPAPSAGAPIS